MPKIIIVGAGLIGTSMALALRDLPIDIEIIEKQLPALNSPATTDSRPISLTYGSHLILKSLGIWDKLQTHVCPIKAVHISEYKRFGHTKIKAKDSNVPALGYVVPFGQLQTAIYQAVAAQSNVTLSSILQLNTIQYKDTAVTVQVDGATALRSITADLLIAADGTHSTCRELLGIATRKENKGDAAWIFDLTLQTPHDFTAYERFTKNGTLAILPLHNPLKARLVWSVSQHNQSVMTSWSNATVLTFIQNCFEGRLIIIDANKTADFPLQTVLAETQIVEGAVLLGNAAHTIYPIAAQGFNLGLHDIAILKDVLTSALENKTMLGSKQTLKQYNDWATPHQEAILKLTNQLTPLFELTLPFAGCARGFGLLSMDIIQPIKNRLAKRAMGVTGKQPTLLQQ